MLFNILVEKLLEYMRSIDRSPNTIRIYKRDLLVAQKYLENRLNGSVYIEDITLDDLESFMISVKDNKKYSYSSRSRFFYTIRSLYKYAYKMDLVKRNIALSMDFAKKPKKERDYVEEEDIKRIIDVIRIPLIKLVAFFLFNTGLRISECLDLTLDDVDLDKKIVFVKEGKGRKDRIVPINKELHEELLDYIENWREGANSDRFFATSKTGSLSYPYVNNVIKRTAMKLGIKKSVTCHVLRHSFASTLVKKNVGLVQISKLLGHSSLAITSIYTHTNIEQLSDAVNMLNS